MTKIVLKFRDAALKEIPVEKELITIGRKPDNDIEIDNLAVSGHHARIFKAGDWFLIEDLDSLNGTFVNGKMIKESPLKPAIVTQGLMEESAPAWIGKITIDRNEEVDTERAAHVVTLHEAAIGHEVGKVCAHPFVNGSHPRHWCQLERHEIAKMDCGKSCH